MLSAVIFDMDGVLSATTEYHFRAWQAVAQEHGIPFTRQDNEKLRGLTRRRSLELLLGDRCVSEEQFVRMLEQKGRFYQVYLQDMSDGDLLPGVARLLEEIHQAGLRIGIASGSQYAAPVVERLGIGRYVGAISDGSVVRVPKPAPDVFLHAAGLLGVAAGECVAVEDARAGVEAALAAGMCVVGVGPEERVGRAHAVFPDLSGVHLEDLRAVYRIWRSARSGADT
jgi:kojibiose phosphorylase